MESVTLEKLDNDIQQMKIQLDRITHIIGEDFELSESVKKELAQARSESISEYVDHKDVMKEFA